MPEKQKKTKDMVIAIFLTILTILCVVFYFLPAFNVKHRFSISDDYDTVIFKASEITQALFSDTAVMESNLEKLLAIKETYGFAIALAGLMMPVSILCIMATTVFAYLSWLKNESFKKYCFIFSLMGMIFATMTLIATWFMAIQIRDGNNFDVFGANLKGSISYGAFVSLILAFVVAIVACAYNYFLDNFDEEDDEEEEDDDEEYEIVKVKKVKPVTATAGANPVLEKAKEKEKDNTKFINKEKKN